MMHSIPQYSRKIFGHAAVVIQDVERIEHATIMEESLVISQQADGGDPQLFSAKHEWSAADGIFYVNVYRDEQGGIHYSTEEFSIGQQGLFTVDAALRDAYALTVKFCDWDYVQTLCSEIPEVTTAHIRKCLKKLGDAYTLVNEREDARNFRMEDIEERAEEIGWWL